MLTGVLSIFLLAHFAIAGIRLEKLFTANARKNIIGWTLLMLFIPFVGALLFDCSKRS